LQRLQPDQAVACQWAFTWAGSPARGTGRSGALSTSRHALSATAGTAPDLSCHVLRYRERMADTWYAPDHRRSLPTRHPSEPLWTLERSGRHVACELRDHGESAGAEVQLLKNGEFYAGRRFETRAMALQHADHVRENLERDGWRIEFPVDR
jgi:hypothetical protein